MLYLLFEATFEKQTNFGVIAGTLSSIVALTLFLIAVTLIVLRCYFYTYFKIKYSMLT